MSTVWDWTVASIANGLAVGMCTHVQACKTSVVVENGRRLTEKQLTKYNKMRLDKGTKR